MKLVTTIVLSSLMAVSGAAMAASGNPTVSTKTVAYTCQQGKKVNVTYGFNKQNLPTYAAVNVKGKKRMMAINLNRSNNMDTMFGKPGAYNLTSSYLDKKTVRTAEGMMITSPNDELLFKDCNPR